jgi:DNA-binding GntR family transcriptional regulator
VRSSPIDNRDLTSQVYTWLKASILNHELPPETKLDVGELATRLGVSRTPVKDAINRLASEGLITLYSRRGTYVTALSVETFLELADARAMLEGWVTDQVTATQLRSIQKQARALFQTGDHLIRVPDALSFDYSAYYALDLELHNAIMRLPGNSTILDLLRQIIDKMTVGRLYFQNYDEAYHRSLDAHEEHRRIVESIEAADPTALQEALRAHLLASRTYTIHLVT